MLIQTKEFDISMLPPTTNEQLQRAYTTLQQKYTKILSQFNSFKQSSILSYEKVSEQLDKCKTQNEQFVKKLEKKYENLLHEERTKAAKNTEKLLSEFQKQRSNLKEIINGKNQTVQKLSELLHKAEQQKSQIIEENTKNLINIVRSEQKCLQTKKYSHTELMKMYQFLLEENNCLKKQLMKVQSTLGEEKSNQKTKRNKNLTQIVYTQQSDKQSDKIESMYVSDQNYVYLARKKDYRREKEHSESVNAEESVIGSHFKSKPNSSYKAKPNSGSKKNQVNSSYYTNDASITIVEQKVAKKKDPLKKPLVTTQNTKKLK